MQRPLGKAALLLCVLALASHAEPRPVICDDDGSADGMVALIACLQSPTLDVRAVTISQGLAHPRVFAPLARRMLAHLGRPQIPVGAGSEVPLAGNNAFPEPWRGDTDRFWGIPLPEVADVASEPAADLIVRTLRESTSPVSLLVTGPLTNVAAALRQAPDVAARIEVVQVMGGAVWVPGNVGAEWPEIDNDVAEWNIWVDPVAAREVLASGVPVRFIPLDATNRMRFTQRDSDAWRAAGTPAGQMAAGLLDYLLHQISPEGVSVWDAVAAAHLIDPSLCATATARIQVVTAPGPTQGWTVPGVRSGPMSEVCRVPMVRRIRSLLVGLFGA